MLAILILRLQAYSLIHPIPDDIIIIQQSL